MKINYRTGAIGALMDEYEKAAEELQSLFLKISVDQYSLILDNQTKDEDCRSVKTILSHVVRSGYRYADYIRDEFSKEKSSPKIDLVEYKDFIKKFNDMLAYSSNTLEGKWNMTDEEILQTHIVSRWGSVYDVEQLLEHAIVHILRHRRQIEKFIVNGKLTIS